MRLYLLQHLNKTRFNSATELCSIINNSLQPQQKLEEETYINYAYTMLFVAQARV